MKKIVLITLAVLFLSAGMLHAEMTHMMGEGQHHGPGDDDTYRMGYDMPGYGMMGYGMGPGMMGCGMGSGMMGGGMMGYGMGPGMMGCGMMDLDRDEYSAFLEKTKDLRKEMHMKKFDYFEAMRSPEKNKEKIDKLRSEIRELRKKIMKELYK